MSHAFDGQTHVPAAAPGRLPAEEARFLPGARRVSDAAPPALAWAVPLLLVLLVAAAILWATLSRSEIVAAAQGALMPAGRVKLVQPAETGVVRAIHVRDGQQVQAGDVLVELDATQATADRDRLAKELAAARLTIARVEAALAGTERFAAPDGADPGLVAVERRALAAEQARFHGELAALDKEVRRLEAQRDATAAQIARVEAVLPLVERRVAAKARLTAQGFAAETEAWALEQELVERRAERAALSANLEAAEAELDAAAARRAQAGRERESALLERLAEAERQATTLAEELKKAESRVAAMTLRAPEDGVVHALALHTLGGVAPAGQPALKLAPTGAALEVEAKILGRDVGFVAVGQKVRVKLEAFDFTKYGALEGEIVGLAPDAEIDEALGPIYRARVRLERQTMHVDGRELRLTPGMAATVDVKTGERRLIDYVLAPLRRKSDESLRER